MDQMSLNYVPGNMLIGEKEDSLERQKGFEAIAKITKEHDAIILAQLANIEDQQGFYKAETTENQILALKRTLWAAKYVYERGFDGILIQFLPAVKDGIVYLELTEKLIETLEKVVRSNIPKEAAFVIGVKLSTAKFEAAGVDYDGFMKVLKKVESCNYDFVELAGGSIEFPLENATSRESLFSKVITSAKSYVPNLSIFATGGFRTVAAMENAVASGSLDGIGLARPSASEFDFPNKVLKQQIQSAMWSPFEDDMSLGVPAAAAQIAQAGKTGLKETQFDANFGISNFADEKTHQSFLTAKKVRDAEIESMKKEGKLIAGVIQF
uniref:Aldolase n=1 Tax=Panagrolaimus davidi TaxID=227884 RepID=A0A914QE91_9BILA